MCTTRIKKIVNRYCILATRNLAQKTVILKSIEKRNQYVENTVQVVLKSNIALVCLYFEKINLNTLLLHSGKKLLVLLYLCLFHYVDFRGKKCALYTGKYSILAISWCVVFVALYLIELFY